MVNYSNQDLPVHCMVAKIEGDWLIHMGDNYSDKDLKCGHENPDQNLDHYNIEVEKVFKKKHEVIVHLERPNKVISVQDNSEIGKWTMIYDEGFEFTIHDQVFFSFSRYKKIGKFSPSNTDTEDTPGYKNMCEKTFIGWFHNVKTNENWGCFWAEQINKNELNKYDLKKLDYINLFINRKIPFVDNHHNTPSSMSNLKKNFIKNEMNKNRAHGDIFSLMNELSSKNDNEPVKKLQPNKFKNNNNPNKIENGPIKVQSENSYVDFVKTLGWDSDSGSNLNNVPHLDIYFLNNMSQNNQGNFLEVENKTKFFRPDYDYINRINNPKNGFLWKAKVYNDFVGKSYSQMRNLLGNVNYMKNLPNRSEAEPTDFLELGIEVRKLLNIGYE
jgi:hypothetical protein